MRLTHAHAGGEEEDVSVSMFFFGNVSAVVGVTTAVLQEEGGEKTT